jgi:hypothetical protein
LSPIGRISSLEELNLLVVTDNAANVLKIYRLVQAIDTKKGSKLSIPKRNKSEPVLRKYRVPDGSADTVAKSLAQEFPGMKMLAIPSTNEILVLATETDHTAFEAKLKEIIKQLKMPEPRK